MTEEIPQVDQFEIRKLEAHIQERIYSTFPGLNIDVWVFMEAVDMAILSREAEATRMCRNCVHWGKEQKADKFLAVDARPCSISPFQTKDMELNDFNITCGHDGPIYCGPNFGCVNFAKNNSLVTDEKGAN